MHPEFLERFAENVAGEKSYRFKQGVGEHKMRTPASRRIRSCPNCTLVFTHTFGPRRNMS